MHVVVCSITLFMPGVGSLKGKRHIIKSITQRIRSRANASVAETDFQDSWQRAEIGVAMVSSDKVMLDRQVNLIRGIVDDCGEAETVEFLVEYV
ncbi:DUF503 domain-containing protein [Sporomusa sp.]|uniref:DUF503 domain-containing protein n=1 Tax=Sporomusa sp. TaxID=2078658 RepID=UPI002CD0E2EA|nr:DUF503 domain-containing protein [Sporomusa sp.]HWR45052.1 DUF503 domain-containing protein [Sporomusa sp.]